MTVETHGLSPDVSTNHTAKADINNLQVVEDTDLFHEISNDNTFLKEHTKGWAHGVKTPYSVFEYNLLKSYSTKTRLKKSVGSTTMDASIVFDKVKHSAFKERESPKHSALNEKESLTSPFYKERLQPSSSDNAFGGYCSIPKISLNLPRGTDGPAVIAQTDIPKFAYQNLYNHADNSYLFGGLTISAGTSLEYLGIPVDVDPSKISVHLPCDFPPFISKSLIGNPLMTLNDAIFLFNPIRGSVTYLDSLNREADPIGIHSLVNCRVSDKHVLFYGGFRVITDSSKYYPNLDRWIINRRIELNKLGYLLDIITLRFFKFEYKSKDDDSIEIARIGACVTSSIFEQSDTSDLPARAPLPPIFADNKGRTDNEIRLPEYNSESFASIQSVSSGSPVSNRSSNLTTQTPNATPSQTPTQKLTPTTSGASNSTHIPSEEISPFPAKQPKSASTKNPGTIITDRTLMKNQTQSSSLSSASSSISKMSSVLSKSTRLFHRHHSKGQTLQQQVSSHQASNLQLPLQPLPKTTTAQPPKLQSKSSSSSSKSASSSTKPAPSSSSTHALLNTYSKQVQQHRTKSSLDPSIQKSKLDQLHDVRHDSKETTSKKEVAVLNVEISSPAPLKPRHAPGLINQIFNGKGSQNPRSPSPSPISPPLSAEGSTTASVGSSDKSLGQHDTKDSPDYDSLTDTSVNAESTFAHNPLFNDSILKSGINSVAIFVFGGFHAVQDEDGYQSFVASNDLLKINLSCKDGPNGLTFDDIALVFSMKDELLKHGNTGVWPSPRGYFASSIIEHNKNRVNCDDSDAFAYGGTSRKLPPQLSKTQEKIKRTTADYYHDRAMVVHGGCNEQNETFSDLYVFFFESATWMILDTFCYDYFENKLDPDQDDDVANFTKEKLVSDAKMVEAELRSCHHTVLYHKSYEQDYLLFLGGLNNDYLRHFDKVPYKSECFDVSRITKFTLLTDNNNVLRVPALNLQSQTWKFLRYHFDIRHSVSDKYIERLSNNPKWVNARMASISGAISLNSGIVTMCQGLMVPIPEKKEDMKEMAEEIPMDSLLWGAHVHFNFPTL